MIKCLFLSGARGLMSLFISRSKTSIWMPTPTQELRTHLNGRRGYLFETNPNDRYSARTMQSIVKSEAREAGIEKLVCPHLPRHSIATILLESGEGHIDQVHTFSCLSILRNAVVAWNTVQIRRIVSELRAEGQQIEAETLSHVTPLLRKHIIPFGRHYFDSNRMQQARAGEADNPQRRFSVECGYCPVWR